MVNNIIGNREVFAVQYSLLQSNSFLPYGDCKIWLGGNYLGGIEGEVYLATVSKLLNSVCLIIEKLILPRDVFKLSASEIFRMMEEEQIEEVGTYWFMYTEGFDLFSKYVYYQDEMLYFLWQFNPDVWNDFKIGDFPGQIFSAKVPLSTYTEVVNQFRDNVLALYPSKTD
jgi:hypothetical protein